MSLVTLEQILKQAKAGRYGIGAFNVANMEMVMGAIEAAEELNSPIILQVAEGRLRYSPLPLIGPVMVAAAKAAKVPVAVHYDHGFDLALIKQALELGFSSVMFDGSHGPLDQNIETTRKVMTLAAEFGASVEAEIGKVGGSEGDYAGVEIMITSVEDAKRFYAETQVHALAVAIGTAHGEYKVEPNLRFDRLQEIHDQVAVPLVLHGGSGLLAGDFRRAITHGVSKVNIATASFQSIVKRMYAIFSDNQGVTYFQLHDAIRQATYENVKEHICIFGSNNQCK
ncbi:class II fructose-bisphosphate aldolase [Propionispora vibrioides]|uniref:Fructose-bisphosphate aldolase n=1 Tax=Propionispora vibrioides TaxID=112903 RepID=A0A1H8R626_9FIRM|nr:class II fructose-bisphosphate aldolase [Propionispora vibrioides]SEO61584.1 fructose-bisphosphate aldolase [Propionispora vibrioides]